MRKVIVKIAFVMMLIAFAYPIKSQAGLQANKNGTSLTVTSTIYANDLFKGIRNMEAYYGTLGKNAIINTTTYLEEGKGNGLDCHMAKNTEWGTIAMLSASSYGVAPSGYSEASTTGNESGVYKMANGNGKGGSDLAGTELVTGIWTGKTSDQYIGTIASADERYYDEYSSETSKPGDATTETAGWKGSNDEIEFISSYYPIFQRGYNGLFGYNDHNGYFAKNSYHYNTFTCAASTRAVVVFGDNL